MEENKLTDHLLKPDNIFLHVVVVQLVEQNVRRE